MNATAHHAFADLRRPTVTTGEADRIASTWRENLRFIGNRLVFIQQGIRTIAERGERLSTGRLVHSPSYIASSVARLQSDLDAYRAAVRRVSEAEEAMTRLGIPFAKSGDAWESA